MNERRLYGFLLSAPILEEFCRNGKREFSVEGPIPDTARFWSSYFDHSRNCFVCIFEDDSFCLVAEGCVIPIGPGPRVTTLASVVNAET